MAIAQLSFVRLRVAIRLFLLLIVSRMILYSEGIPVDGKLGVREVRDGKREITHPRSGHTGPTAIPLGVYRSAWPRVNERERK
jgi:hypothetical protein